MIYRHHRQRYRNAWPSRGALKRGSENSNARRLLNPFPCFSPPTYRLGSRKERRSPISRGWIDRFVFHKNRDKGWPKKERLARGQRRGEGRCKNNGGGQFTSNQGARRVGLSGLDRFGYSMNSRLTQAAYCRTRHHGNSTRRPPSSHPSPFLPPFVSFALLPDTWK